MHYTIYFDDKPLLLADENTEEVQRLRLEAGTEVFESSGENRIQEIITAIQQEQTKAVLVLHEDADKLLESFKKALHLIVAAGGLVYTVDQFLLLIYRKGKWDLPKGKVDNNDPLEDTAIRELKEETGIKNITIEAPLCITYHTYYQHDKLILKESHWYLLSCGKKQVLTPQTEEDIEKCEWVEKNGLSHYLENMHRSVKDVLEEGLKRL